MRPIALALLLTGRVMAAPPDPLVLWSADEIAGVAGVELETGNVREGKAAVRWRNHPAQPGIELPPVPADWRGYGELRFLLHSARAVPTRIMVIISSENPATEGPDYWGFPISLNYSGWREQILELRQDGGARQPRGWDQIDSVRFTASGWDNTPHADADLLIDHVRLVAATPAVGPRLSDESFFEALDLDRPELKAVKEAVGRTDWAAAKAALMEHLRTRHSPRWWFDWRERPEVEPLSGGSEGWDYYGTGIKVDWTGWKHFVLPLERFGASRRPLGWDHIQYLSFSATYGDRRPSPRTRLVIDSVALQGPKPLLIADFEPPAGVSAWTGVSPTVEAKEGEQAALWVPATHGSITNRTIPHDWSGQTALSFWLWSGEATGDHVTVIADSDTPNLDAANRVMAHIQDGCHLGEDINWSANKLPPTEPAFTREWTYSLNRFFHWRILGDAYWQSGDEKYAREWIAQMRDWVEDNPYPLNGTGNNTLTWRTIEAGIRTSSTWPDSLMFFLGSPSLTPDDLVTFLKSWIEHAHHLMRITVEHPEHGGNWVTMECNGLGHLGILLPEAKDARLWLKTATERLNLELDRQVYPDGAQMELTTGYHQVARNNFVDLLKVARLNDAPLPTDYAAKLEKMYDYNLKAMTPDGALPPLNDAGYTAVRDSLREGDELFSRPDFRWAGTAGVEGTPPAYTSVAFPYAGQYIMRSGWGADDRYLLFESGPYGIGHQHEDMLSLFAYGLGRVLLTEAGTYSYDASAYRRYVLSTWGHNTILVDGHGQQRNGLRETYATDKPLDNLWVTGELFDAADGIYRHGYGPQRAIDVTHDRTVVFLRPGYWLVLDRLTGTGSHRYDILWNLNNDAAEQDPATKAAWGADPELANLLVTPAETAGLGLEIVTGRHDPPLGFAPASRKKPVPCLDYQITADGPVTIAWALTPFRGERPDIVVRTSDRPDGTLVRISGPEGEDQVLVARRGATATLALEDRTLTGRVIVVRRPAGGPVRAASCP